MESEVPYLLFAFTLKKKRRAMSERRDYEAEACDECEA